MDVQNARLSSQGHSGTRERPRPRGRLGPGTRVAAPGLGHAGRAREASAASPGRPAA